MKNSFRLGVLLVGLVGINVYVFFFNRKTAPREVLNLQSTSRTMEVSRREILKDARLPAPQPAKAGPAARPAPAPAAAEPPPPVAAEPAAPQPIPTEAPSRPPVILASASGQPAFRIPFAPPPEPAAPRPVAPAHAPYQIPFAPPPEDDSDARDDGVEKKFSQADTLGQVLTREGFGPAAPQVVAALAKLVDPRSIRGGQKYVVRVGEDGAPASFEYVPSPALRYLVERNEDSGAWSGKKLAAAVDVRTAEAGGVVDSSLYESVQKAGESTALVSLLVELFAWDVNFYTDTHPGDHWKVVIEKQFLGGQFYKYGRVLAAEYGGKTGTFRAFFWNGKGAPRDKPGKYYDEHGLAL